MAKLVQPFQAKMDTTQSPACTSTELRFYLKEAIGTRHAINSCVISGTRLLNLDCLRQWISRSRRFDHPVFMYRAI